MLCANGPSACPATYLKGRPGEVASKASERGSEHASEHASEQAVKQSSNQAMRESASQPLDGSKVKRLRHRFGHGAAPRAWSPYGQHICRSRLCVKSSSYVSRGYI